MRLPHVLLVGLVLLVGPVRSFAASSVPLKNAVLQSNMDGGGNSFTNLDTVTATNAKFDVLTLAGVDLASLSSVLDDIDDLEEAIAAFSTENQTMAAQWTLNDLVLPKVPTYTVTTNTGTALEYDWAGAPVQLRLVTGDATRSAVNAPTGTNAVWGPIELLIANEDTNCTLSQIDGHVLFGRLTVGGIVPTEIAPGTVILYQALYTPFTTWFFWRGNQDSTLAVVLGGSGNIYGIADAPSYKSSTLSLAALTNIYPDFSQGAFRDPLNINTNLNIADPTGYPATGRVREIEFEVTNTNATGTNLLTWSSEWTPRGFSTNYHEIAFSNTVQLKLRARGTTPYIILNGGSGVFSGGTVTPPWVPGVLWDMESDHSFVISSGTYSALWNQQNTSSPLLGSKSATITTTNVAHFMVRSAAQTTSTDLYLSMVVSYSGSLLGAGTLFDLQTSADSYRLDALTTGAGAISIGLVGGSYTANHATTVTSASKVYIKIRYSTDGSSSAGKLWIMSDPSAGWGTALEATGTSTTGVAKLGLHNRTGFGNSRVIKVDQVVWSDGIDIPASYYVP